MVDIAGNRRSVGSRTAARHGSIAVALCGVQFVDVLGVTVVVTALPRMLTDLGATPALGSVVVTAYAMFFGGLLMVASLAALVLFAAASALAGLAGSVWLLATARAVQGIGGVLAAAGFARLERRASHPLVPSAARRSPVLRWGAFGSFFNTATTSSSITVATLYLQGELGLTPLRAAGLLGTFSILLVLGSLGAPRLITAFGSGRTLGIGLGIVAAGNTLLAASPQVIGIGAAAGTCGLGIGTGSVAATDLGTAVDEAIKGTAAGVLNTAAQLGTAIGTALILLAATVWQPRIAWAVAAVLPGVAATAAAARAPRDR